MIGSPIDLAERREGFWYLATPYSKYPGGIEAAFREAAAQAGVLIADKVPVYSPIAHTHPIAVQSRLDPLDHAIWLPADKPMMDAACGLIICMMDGWDESKGIAHEIEVFSKAGKPIVRMYPDEVPQELSGYRE